MHKQQQLITKKKQISITILSNSWCMLSSNLDQISRKQSAQN